MDLAPLHTRLPETVAHLFLGLEVGIEFALRVGSLDEASATHHLKTGWEALLGLVRAHGKMIGDERPTQAFLEAIIEGLAADKAWLAHRQTGEVAAGVQEIGSEKLGWSDAEGIYLLPVTAFNFAARQLSQRGGLHVSERALRQMLRDDGYLLRDPSELNRLASKRWCEGKTQRVLWLTPGALGD